METYYAYLRWCQDYNERNLIDPTSDKMEWHHTLPQCIFGDVRIGLWLTLKQHAIATALQSLAFGQNCLCPWHVKYLPEELWSAVRPLYCKDKEEIAKNNPHALAYARTCIDREVQREAARRVGQGHSESGHAQQLHTYRDPDKVRENAKKLGEVNGQIARDSGLLEIIRPLGAAAQHAQRWINLAPGYPQYESTPCGLTKWQKARGIDHTDKSLRRRIS